MLLPTVNSSSWDVKAGLWIPNTKDFLLYQASVAILWCGQRPGEARMEASTQGTW